MQNLKYYFLASCLIILSGCSGDDKSIENYTATVKKTMLGKIEILPVAKQYRGMDYTAQNFLSPFEKGVRNDNYSEELEQSAKTLTPRPDADRNREFLEQDPINTYIMVGTLTKEGANWGLVKDRKGMVHAVKIGDYIGQNSGKIVDISENQINLIETVIDGNGGWVEAKTSMNLKAN